MNLAIFDLDNTLIAGDSDFLWGEFLCEHKLINESAHQEENARYFAEYRDGKLDIEKFLQFQLRFITGKKHDDIVLLRQQFIQEKIQPIILEKAVQLVEKHRKDNHHLLIITATNRFITAPVAELFNIQNLIATEVEMINDVYTGKHNGIPSFAKGKVSRLQMWLEENLHKPEKIWFYSDSHNDLPLLEFADYPVAVDPDEILDNAAKKHNWPVISLR